MGKLTAEQRVALQEHPEGVACEDPKTQRVYFLVDSETYRRAIQAIKRQQDRVVPLDQASEELRTRLRLQE